jgi:hypothetical protein
LREVFAEKAPVTPRGRRALAQFFDVPTGMSCSGTQHRQRPHHERRNRKNESIGSVQRPQRRAADRAPQDRDNQERYLQALSGKQNDPQRRNLGRMGCDAEDFERSPGASPECADSSG